MIPIIILITVVSSPTAILSPPELTIPISTGTPGPSATIVETLFYDDGTVYSAWCWYYEGNGWGYYFTTNVGRFIEGMGIYIYEGWPVPGGDRCIIRFTDWENEMPGKTYLEEEITVTPGEWNWYTLPTPLWDYDGKFCVFYIQVGNYPNCCGLAEDSAQENPAPDWWTDGSSYGRGFPRNDFLIRVIVST